MKLETHSPMKSKVQKKDHAMITTSGTMDRGAFDFHTRISEHEGDIMSVATRDVITIPPTTRIIDAIKTMTKKHYTLDNTDGYTGRELSTLNAMYYGAITGVDPDDLDELQRISEQVLRDFDNLADDQ